MEEEQHTSKTLQGITSKNNEHVSFDAKIKQTLGCIAHSVTCLTVDPGIASSILAQSHTFVEIDHEIISTAILLPSLIQEGGSDFRLYDGSDLKTYLLMRW